MIEIRNINKSYQQLQVLKNVSTKINKGEIVSIVGSSGAGKTTLLQIVGTLLNADSGKIIINNIDVSTLNSNQLAAFRNQHIGFVFQFHHLLPEFTAFENVCIPGYIAKKNKKEVDQRALELLKFLNVDHRKLHKPMELSGGEQQRVAVARALMNKPSVILADEPSGNLDTENKKELHKLFFELRDKLQQTFVVVTHDMELAEMADRKLVMRDGAIVE